MSLSAAFPADASPDAGRYEHPTTGPQPPVGTLPTGPHAEAEAAAIRAAHGDAEAPERLPAPEMDPAWPASRGLVMFGTILTADQREVGPGVADWPTAPPSYSDTSTGRVLADIDAAIGENLRARNQFLRRQLADTVSRLSSERSQRQDAQVQLAQAVSERDALAVKLAETERALWVLAAATRHAIKHDEKGGSDG